MDIDTALGRIGQGASHPDLDGLEDRVLATIGERPDRAMATRTTLAAAAGALLLGVVSAVYPVPQAQASQLAPFGVPGPLMPSARLLGSR